MTERASELVRGMCNEELQERYLNAVAGIEVYVQVMGRVRLSEETEIHLSVMRAEMDERNLLRPH